MFGLPTGEDENGLGQIFLLACYGFILFKAAVLIGDGCEKLLLLYGPGVIGGLVIPILGAVPDGAIVLVSGLGSDAQSQVSVGVGTLAGSTIMLLTIPWSLGVVLGCRDYDEKTQKAASYPDTRKPKHENGITLFQSCITTHPNIPFAAKIMMALALSYLIVAIPAAINKNHSNAAKAEQVPALVGLIVCSISFIFYAGYQIWDSRSQKLIEMRQKNEELSRWQQNISNRFGKTENALRAVFDKFDKDHSGTIDRNELHAGFQAMGLECSREQVFQIMQEMNTDEDVDTLTFDEFAAAIKKWSTILLHSKDVHHAVELEEKEIQKKKASMDDEITTSEASPLMSNKQDNNGQINNSTNKDPEALNGVWKDDVEHEEEEDELELHLTDQQLLIQALLLLLAGTSLCIIFSDPMVEVIENFSDSINVDSFYVSFIITPIASNASEIYSSLMFARKKTTESASLALSSLYGAASMNSTFVLGIFCMLVYARELEWTFLVETMVILLTILVVGIIGTRQTIFVWHACIVFSMFPLSLLLVATLEGPMDD